MIETVKSDRIYNNDFDLTRNATTNWKSPITVAGFGIQFAVLSRHYRCAVRYRISPYHWPVHVTVANAPSWRLFDSGTPGTAAAKTFHRRFPWSSVCARSRVMFRAPVYYAWQVRRWLTSTPTTMCGKRSAIVLYPLTKLTGVLRSHISEHVSRRRSLPARPLLCIRKTLLEFHPNETGPSPCDCRHRCRVRPSPTRRTHSVLRPCVFSRLFVGVDRFQKYHFFWALWSSIFFNYFSRTCVNISGLDGNLFGVGSYRNVTFYAFCYYWVGITVFFHLTQY